MKKIFLFVIFIFSGDSFLSAQCYGNVKYDNSVTANNLSTFNITTANPNELILIAYNGWPGPGLGPVTVDGNAATHINTAQTSNSATAEVYCYSAPNAGTHTIVCTETGYSQFNPPNYILNFASAFYVTGTCTPLSCSSLTTTEVAVGSGTSISSSITTTTPNEIIYSSFVYNTGLSNPYAMTETGVTVTDSLHVGDGIDAAEGYTNAPTAGVYNINTSDINSCCGGGTVLVGIIPPLCSVGTMVASPSHLNPTCGYCNGSINVTVSGGAAPYTYQWTPSISTRSSASNLCAGTYSINVKDASSCGDTTVVVTLPAPTGIIVNAHVTANEPCNGNCVGSASSNIIGGVFPYTYIWTPSGGSDSTANNLCAGTYTVTAHDANGCTGTASVSITQPNAIHVTVSSIPVDSACTGQNVILNASGANNYIWSTGNTNSSDTVLIPSGDTAYYGVKGMDGGCSDSTSIKIKIIPPITASINVSKDSICPNDTTTLTAMSIGGPATYRWNTGASTATIHVSDSGTTTYTVTVFGMCNTLPVTKTITVIPLPKLTISGTQMKCKGTRDTLTVSSSVNPTTYLWSDGSTKNKYYTGPINADSTIYVTAKNSLGCEARDSFTIREKPFPTGTVKYVQNCGNTLTLITAAGTGAGPFTYKWNTGSTNDTIDVLVPDTTTFTVVISNGCSITKTVTVDADIPALSVCCNTTIILGSDTTIVANGADIIRYVWAPNIGLNCDTCAAVIATPSVTTTYTVTGTDANGCTVEKTVTILIEIPCIFDIPNVFTPTYAGPLGNDDKFYINSSNPDITSWSLLIFDRWGREVFKNSNPNVYWDGKTESGTDAPSGVYYYVINSNCQGTPYKKEGFVQLIR